MWVSPHIRAKPRGHYTVRLLARYVPRNHMDRPKNQKLVDPWPLLIQPDHTRATRGYCQLVLIM